MKPKPDYRTSNKAYRMYNYKVQRIVELEVNAPSAVDAEMQVATHFPMFQGYDDSTELLADLIVGFMQLYPHTFLETALVSAKHTVSLET